MTVSKTETLEKNINYVNIVDGRLWVNDVCARACRKGGREKAIPIVLVENFWGITTPGLRRDNVRPIVIIHCNRSNIAKEVLQPICDAINVGSVERTSYLLTKLDQFNNGVQSNG